MSAFDLNRRRVLQALLAAGAAGATSASFARKTRAAADKTKFLITFPLFGGGAIIDSFLPIKASESNNATTIDCFPDDQVTALSGSDIRCADPIITSILGFDFSDSPVALPLSGFGEKHKHEMMVTTLTGTSVNHAIAQRRALSGGGAWSGRTLQEIVAAEYGQGFALPNVNMSSLGYLERGSDTSLPAEAYAEPIPNALLKPLSFSGSQGIKGAPSKDMMKLARGVRDEQLDANGEFYSAFYRSKKLDLWSKQRLIAQNIEDKGLIDEVMFIKNSPPQIPLEEYGLHSAPEADDLLLLFPDMFNDPLEQQAALACLLIKRKVSVAVTISASFAPVNGGPLGLKSTPLAFDLSHQDHRFVQAFMWTRCLGIADKVITFLKANVYDEETGETFWDRTMMHFPTDFGRDKRRLGGAPFWGTGHELNNGHLTVSPMVNGNTVLGGVDPDTGMTYGFDLESGDADAGRNTAEGESFAGLLQAIGIDTSVVDLPNVPAMRKG